MDFFSAQASARRQSRLLGWAFAACVTAVVTFVVGWAAFRKMSYKFAECI